MPRFFVIAALFFAFSSALNAHAQDRNAYIIRIESLDSFVVRLDTMYLAYNFTYTARTLDGNLKVVFGVPSEEFSLGSLAELEFSCSNYFGERVDCLESHGLLTFVNGHKVTLNEWYLCMNKEGNYENQVQEATVAHGPGDVAPFEPYRLGYMIHASCGQQHMFLDLRATDAHDYIRMPRLKRGDPIEVLFETHFPFLAVVLDANGAPIRMNILSVGLNDWPK